jgi:MoxR-like ATPase
MNLDLSSFAFGTYLNSGTGTPSWGTALGQSQPAYKFTYPGAEVILIGMVYCSVPLDRVSLPLGKGGRIYRASELDECQIASLFKKVYINGSRINYPFIMVLVKEDSASHPGRKSIKYSDKITYDNNGEHFSNAEFISQARNVLGLKEEACWFVYSIEVYNQDELHMSAVVVDKDNSIEYENSSERRDAWLDLIEAEEGTEVPKKDILRESIYPLQQIFYGAPGTGKSNTIKKEVDERGKKNFRVTFHPDSDYSTFVGAYKPAMKSPDREYSFEELVVKLNEIKLSGVTYPCHKFSAQYWKSLKKLTPEEIKQLLKACGFTDTMNVEVGKGIAVGEELSAKNKEEQIVYRFVPQAFTKAYTAAWNTEDDIFLIIEEINRGNCAQIFGDLFQLLDRGEDGFSEYPVDSDSDLAEHIAKELSYSPRTDFPEGVKEGKKLVLPKNLYIWATMNTSDQSLFPIDSAFKRRWDWKYVPIYNSEEGWQIEVKGARYDWWDFLEKMNDKISSTTHSEDKKLGYYFCKTKNGIINAETFVGKVIFYVWNDVFKDFAEEAGNLFKDENGDLLSYDKFYGVVADGNTKVLEDRVALFLEHLEVKPVNEEDSDDDEEDEEDTSDLNTISLYLKYNGSVVKRKNARKEYRAVMALIAQDEGVQNLANIVPKELMQDPPEGSTKKFKPLDGQDGWFLATNHSIDQFTAILKKIKQSLNINLESQLF